MKISNSFKRAILFFAITISALNGYTQGKEYSVSSTESNQVLPVTLLSFYLKSDEPNKIVVKWQTASETNNSHFSVQVSNDGKNFIQYAVVKGKGNTNELTDYQIVIDVKSKVLTGSFFLSLLLISAVRNRKLQMLVIALFIISFLSCAKNEITEQKHYYVKLVQVDNDAKTTVLHVAVLNLETTK